MLTGTKLAHYEIQKKIGSGGMGEVYLAQDEQLDRKVALKVLLPEFCCNEERMQRFKQEARAASALNHPNIITIYEIGESDERLFIATEYVDGETLREKIDAGNLSVLDAVKIAEQVADALAVAHEEIAPGDRDIARMKRAHFRRDTGADLASPVQRNHGAAIAGRDRRDAGRTIGRDP